MSTTHSKLFQKALLRVNRDVEKELTWVADHLLHSDGIHFPCSVSWSYDALSPSILHCLLRCFSLCHGFLVPLSVAQGFQAPAHQNLFTRQARSIFYFEALCVCAAILDAAPRLLPDQRLAVHRDNINTIQYLCFSTHSTCAGGSQEPQAFLSGQATCSAAMLDGDEYSAQKCLISIAQLPGFEMKGHQQLPGMLRHQHA